MSTELFVYYRVRAAELASALAAVERFQAALPASLPGIAWGLSRRADEHGEHVTLLETYRLATASAEDAPRAIEALAMAQIGPWIVGERHVERFVPCA